MRVFAYSIVVGTSLTMGATADNTPLLVLCMCLALLFTFLAIGALIGEPE